MKRILFVLLGLLLLATARRPEYTLLDELSTLTDKASVALKELSILTEKANAALKESHEAELIWINSLKKIQLGVERKPTFTTDAECPPKELVELIHEAAIKSGVSSTKMSEWLCKGWKPTPVAESDQLDWPRIVALGLTLVCTIHSIWSIWHEGQKAGHAHNN